MIKSYIQYKISNFNNNLKPAQHEISSGKSPCKNKSAAVQQSFCGAVSATQAAPKTGVVKTMLNGIDKFQRTLEKGGFFAEFIVVDFFGMMVPRTWQAYNRNKEELGHVNHKAGREEAIREVLSGPSFFIIPLAFLAASRGIFGPASHIKLDLLKKFKGITEGLMKNKNETLDKDFYKNVVEDIYKGHATKDEKATLIDDFNKIHEDYTYKRIEEKNLGFFSKIAKTFFYKDHKDIKKLKNELADKMIAIHRRLGDNAEVGTDFSDSTKFNFKGIKKNAREFVDDCVNYSSDVINAVKAKGEGTSKDFLTEIHDFKEGARRLITTASVVALSSVLYYIPILYKQNKQFPGIDGLVEEQNKKGGW